MQTNDRYPPRLPDKPMAYSRSSSDVTTMDQILTSLNIDDDYSLLPRQQNLVAHEQLGRDDQRLSASPVPNGYGHHESAAPRNTIGNESTSKQRIAADTYLPATRGAKATIGRKSVDYGSAEREPWQHQVTHNSPKGSPGALQPSEADRNDNSTPNGLKRPVRKPVVLEKPRRSYFSPDDLDELVSDLSIQQTLQARNSQQPQDTILVQQAQRPPSQAFPFDSGVQNGQASRRMSDVNRAPLTQSPYDIHYERDRRNSAAGYISPIPSNYGSPAIPSASIHRSSTGDSFYKSNPRSNESIQDRLPQFNHVPSGTMGFGPGPSLRQISPTRRDQFAQLSQLRIPSPPTRTDSAPLTEWSAHASRPSTAFLEHPDLAPPSRAYGTSQSDFSAFVPPSRQPTAPPRSMSSLSNNSQRSPERQLRHPILDLETQYGGRIPSPDRTEVFPDLPPMSPEDREGAASVLPISQIRRGRQRGEQVIESDLPAMPPLFAHQEDQPYQQLALASTPSLPRPTPPLSPVRSPTVTPQIFQRRSKSPSKEVDLLQSVKVLPIKPIKCPPLCVEERYHPFAFVKTNKFKIKVRIDQRDFVAGGEVFGHIDFISDEGFRAQFGNTQVQIGELGVEFIGYEEIHNPDTGHQPRSLTFLYGRKIFQKVAEVHPIRAEEEHILTSAVLNEPTPDQDGYRAAAKGTNSFPFAFPLPVDVPSSADMHVAKIKYLITGYATVKLQGSQEIIATSESLRVVEAWDIGNPVYTEPVEAAQGRDIANYQEVAAVAKIPKSLYIEGQTISGTVRVANHSSKKVREVKFLLVNRVTFFGDKRGQDKDLNPVQDAFVEQTVSGFAEPRQILRGEEESWIFNVQIPVDRCISIRNSALFEVTPMVLIKFSTGPLQKSTKLYIPHISIANAKSMVDGEDRLAPTSDLLKWSNLPSLFRYQMVVNRQPQEVRKGYLELTELATYITAHERVFLLGAA